MGCLLCSKFLRDCFDIVYSMKHLILILFKAQQDIILILFEHKKHIYTLHAYHQRETPEAYIGYKVLVHINIL